MIDEEDEDAFYEELEKEEENYFIPNEQIYRILLFCQKNIQYF